MTTSTRKDSSKPVSQRRLTDTISSTYSHTLIEHRDTGNADRAYTAHDVSTVNRGKGHFERTYSDVISHCQALSRHGREE